MTTDAWIAVAGIGITVTLFWLGLVATIIGFFLKWHMTKVEKQLEAISDSMAGIRVDLAVVSTTQKSHESRIKKHSDILIDLIPLLKPVPAVIQP